MTIKHYTKDPGNQFTCIESEGIKVFLPHSPQIAEGRGLRVDIHVDNGARVSITYDLPGAAPMEIPQ